MTNEHNTKRNNIKIIITNNNKNIKHIVPF